MGGRYLVSGVELGMMMGQQSKTERKKLMDDIIKNQHVGNSKRDLMKDVEYTRLTFDGAE